MRISAPSSRVQICRSGLSTVISPTVWMSPAVTTPGPCFFTTMRLGPSPCILMAMSLMLSTMSVTSSRTPAIEENSCSTPSMCTDCTAAPCSDDNRIRRSALPSVTPKPRSSGSATTVATRRESVPALTCSLLGRISSCQFFWIVTLSPIALRGATMSRASLRSVRPRSCGGRCWIWSINRMSLYAPPLARPATVMRDRRHIADRRNGEAGGLQRAQRRLASRTGARDLHLECAHAVFLRLLSGVLGRDLRGVRRRLARALEPHRARRGPGNSVALHVGDGDHRIVERRVDVCDARSDVLAFAPADARSFLTHSEPFRGWEPAALAPAPSLVPVVSLLLLAGYRLGRTLAGARVGVSALSANRQAAAVSQSPVAAQIHQTLDVHGHFAPQVAFDDVVAVDHFTQLKYFLIGELRNPPRLGDRNLFHDFLGFGIADAMDVLERDHNALVGRYVDARDTSHFSYSLRPPPAVPARLSGMAVSRCSSIALSPETATNVKRQRLPAFPARHRCSISNWVFAVGINGFLLLSSTSASELVHKHG